jgi:hypothetical protein
VHLIGGERVYGLAKQHAAEQIDAFGGPQIHVRRVLARVGAETVVRRGGKHLGYNVQYGVGVDEVRTDACVAAGSGLGYWDSPNVAAV